MTKLSINKDYNNSISNANLPNDKQISLSFQLNQFNLNNAS